MKTLIVVLGVLLIYLGSVVYFETSIGLRQPEFPGGTIYITTFDSGGAAYRRVVSPLESDGKLYVAANHWPRAWYRRALENPDVRVTIDSRTSNYRAVPVEDAERERLAAEHPISLKLRFRMGFAPRAFLRLDPRP